VWAWGIPDLIGQIELKKVDLIWYQKIDRSLTADG